MKCKHRIKDCLSCNKYSIDTTTTGPPPSYIIQWENPKGKWINSDTRFPRKRAVYLAEEFKKAVVWFESIGKRTYKTPKRIFESADPVYIKSSRTCTKLCAINRKYYYQDSVFRDSNVSLLYGPVLGNMVESSVWDLSSPESSSPPPYHDFLTKQENEVVKLRSQRRTYKEISRAMSGGRRGWSVSTQKVSTLWQSAKRKTEKHYGVEKPLKRQTPPPLPFNRIPKALHLPLWWKVKDLGAEISKIDRRCGTDLRWWYNNRVKGKKYPPESLLTMSQEFWKRPAPQAGKWLGIHYKSGRCYYPEDKKYTITAPVDPKAPRLKPRAGANYYSQTDFGGMDNSTIENFDDLLSVIENEVEHKHIPEGQTISQEEMDSEKSLIEFKRQKALRGWSVDLHYAMYGSAFVRQGIGKKFIKKRKSYVL